MKDSFTIDTIIYGCTNVRKWWKDIWENGEWYSFPIIFGLGRFFYLLCHLPDEYSMIPMTLIGGSVAYFTGVLFAQCIFVIIIQLVCIILLTIIETLFKVSNHIMSMKNRYGYTALVLKTLSTILMVWSIVTIIRLLQHNAHGTPLFTHEETLWMIAHNASMALMSLIILCRKL